jgi:hypothetical protein
MLDVGLLDTPKFDTFYRVFKKAFENKTSSKPFGLLPFGAFGASLLRTVEEINKRLYF